MVLLTVYYPLQGHPSCKLLLNISLDRLRKWKMSTLLYTKLMICMGRDIPHVVTYTRARAGSLACTTYNIIYKVDSLEQAYTTH